MKTLLQAHWVVRFVVAAVFSVACFGAHAQTTTATLSGLVRDPSGAVVPQVKITLKNAAKGTSRTTLTDSDGRYNLPAMEPGTYELRAERTGFSTEVKSGVVLAVGGSAQEDLTLRVGSATEVITVTDQAPLVETAKAEVSNVITEQAIQALPNIGRNFVDFVKLSSGVAPGRENTGGGAFKEPDAGVGSSAAPRLTFGGQSELNTKVLVDGADNVQTFTGLPRTTPSQESAQEFRVVNNTFAAEYGGAMGGFVNIVTKSGGNNLHGSAYYYGMNNAFNAQPILTGPNPVLRQNQYGATLSGPIKKDQTFWFGNYEGQRRAESNKFSSIILNNLAAINATKAFYGLSPETSNSLRSNDYDGFLLKLDHKLGEKHGLAFRYNLLDSQTLGFLGGGGRASPASTTARNNKTFDQSFLVTETAMFRPNIVNEARFQWARRSFDFLSVLKQPDLEVSNLLITGKSTSDPDFYEESRIQLGDSLSLNVGRHQVKFGADFNHINDDSKWDLFFPARIIFPTLTAFINHTPAVFWFPLLNGAATHPGFSVPFTQDVPTAWEPFTNTTLAHNAIGFFAQDEWKTTQKLTLTYGLRYDFETYPSRFGLNSDMNNVQPRVGMAYAYSKHGVVRAGFGIFNDRLVSSIGQVFNTAEWLSAGYQPHAQQLFPGISTIKARFIQPTVGGPGAITATNNFLATGMPPTLAVPPVGFTDNLDANLREEMRFEIRRLHETFGITTLYVTHDQAEAMVISDRIAVLDRGRVAQVGSAEEIFQQPRTRFVADFIGRTNLVDAVAATPDAVTRGALRLRVASADLTPGARVSVSIRPHEIAFATSTEGHAGDNVVSGRVRRVSYLGDAVDYQVEIADSDVVLRVAGPAAPRLRAGDAVWLRVLHGRALPA